MIPNNVRTVRLTAAAGTNLARASSRDRSHPFGLSSPSTVLYNPKAFVAHAASLGQACAHCRRSSTAASRRSLASVSVPVARVVLSHPLDIFALVGRHPTNQLISRGPRPGRRTCGPPGMPPKDVAWNYPVFLRAMPGPGVGCPRPTAPYAGSPGCPGFPRLACLIHAANVRSEPGSNPSRVYPPPLAGRCLSGLKPPLSGRSQSTSRPARPRPSQPGRVRESAGPPAAPRTRRLLTNQPLVKEQTQGIRLEGRTLRPDAAFCRRVHAGKGNNIHPR